MRSEPYKLPDGTWSHEQVDHAPFFFLIITTILPKLTAVIPLSFCPRKPDYVPPSKPWEMSEVLDGLLEFALRMLKPNGRLVESHHVHLYLIYCRINVCNSAKSVRLHRLEYYASIL